MFVSLIIIVGALFIWMYGSNSEYVNVSNSSFELPDSYEIIDNHSNHEVGISNGTNKLVIVQMGKGDLKKTIEEYENGLNNSLSIQSFKTHNNVNIEKTSVKIDNKTFVRYYFEKSGIIFHIDTQNEVKWTDNIAIQIIDSMNV